MQSFATMVARIGSRADFCRHHPWCCMGGLLLALSCSDSTREGQADSAGGGGDSTSGVSGGGTGGTGPSAASTGSGGSAVATTGSGGTAAPSSGGTAGSSGGSGATGSGGASSSGGATATGGNGGEPAGGAAGEVGATDCEPFVMPEDCEPASDGPLPLHLRCTGLYGNWDTREYRCDVREYRPAFQLWSDGAEKHRFVSLPPESTIDVSVPEAFDYPVGTQFWKEFWIPTSEGDKLGETRLLRKTAAGWLYTSYVWSASGDQAVQTNAGVSNWQGTGHTVPSREQCRQCHEGRRDFVLGWDFLMLGAGAEGMTLNDLVDEGRLGAAEDALLPDPIDWLELEVPGDSVEQAGLGYLHANCGVSCHNREPKAGAESTGFYLRLDSTTLDSVQTTDAALTGINRVPGPQAELPPGAPGTYYDLLPLDSARSLAAARMRVRDDGAMPRLGTNQVDDDGVDVVSAWIEHMTEARGYPAPAP